MLLKISIAVVALASVRAVLSILGARSSRDAATVRRFARQCLVVTLVCGAAAMITTVVGLLTAFSSIAGADPAIKARMLAEGIHEAMLGGAVGFGGAFLPGAAMIYLSVRAGRLRRAEASAPRLPDAAAEHLARD